MDQKSINPKQKDFFNEKACVWDKITIHNPEKVQYITELLDLQKSDKILDIGTGTGIMIPFYEKYIVDGCIVAVDYSEKMIEVARAKYPKKDHPLVSYRVSDIYDLKYAEEFDLVMCYSCFPHFTNQPLAIKILSGALKRGGQLVVAHSNSADKINGVHMSGGVEIKNDFLPSIATLMKLMEENGLTVTFHRDDENYYICIAKKST